MKSSNHPLGMMIEALIPSKAEIAALFVICALALWKVVDLAIVAVSFLMTLRIVQA